MPDGGTTPNKAPDGDLQPVPVNTKTEAAYIKYQKTHCVPNLLEAETPWTKKGNTAHNCAARRGDVVLAFVMRVALSGPPSSVDGLRRLRRGRLRVVEFVPVG